MDNGFAIVPALPDADIEFFGHVAADRNFVGGWRVGAQSALFVPPQFLAGQPTDPLHKPAFNLAKINGRVNRAAHVMQDVDLP